MLVLYGSQLIDAALNGKAAEVDALLKGGADKETKNEVRAQCPSVLCVVSAVIAASMGPGWR